MHVSYHELYPFCIVILQQNTFFKTLTVTPSQSFGLRDASRHALVLDTGPLVYFSLPREVGKSDKAELLKEV